MKIDYILPSEEQKIADEVLQGEKILYCTPFDLTIVGNVADGYFVITKQRYLILQNKRLLQTRLLQSGEEYTLVTAVGNGMLEAKVEGRDIMLLRFSMAHVPRYAYIASILNSLANHGIPKIVSDNREEKCLNCGRMYPRGTKTCYRCSSKGVVFKRWLELMKPYARPLVISLCVFWIIIGLSLVTPFIYRYLIDNYLTPQKAEALPIFFLIMGLAVSELTRTLLNIYKNRMMNKVGLSISRDLRQMVYEKLQSLSIAYLDTQKTGDLMNRVTGDTNRIQDFICNQASMGINQILLLIVVSGILFVMNWRLASLILLPAPFIAYYFRIMRRKFRKMYGRQWRISDRSNSILHDILRGIKVVKAFGMEEKAVGRFEETSKELADITASNEKTYNTIFPFLHFIMGIGNFFILYYGGKYILAEQMELGELIQFTSYAGMIYGPLGFLTFFPRAFTQAITSTERIFEILDEESFIQNESNARKIQIEGNVVLEQVTFGYQFYEPVVKDINLEVKKGEMIGLVGHSGAGKSTLINLIMRLYDVDEGRITIDGVDIQDIDQMDLRSQIGVVLQETFLFTGTILQNITYAKPNASLEDVIQAAKIANAHDFIIRFPDGYDTKVGERGQRLSGGEKQRIAIARAILHDPKILILDEATASVDTETEYQIQEALGRLVKNRTTFAIAHRLSTLRNATRLLVLDEGKAIELGTHDELMNKKGKYYSLVMAQREMSRTKAG